MSLTRLEISRLRNLQSVRLPRLAAAVNVIYGANGSGKTSVLESVHMLGMARSFRTHKTQTLITHGTADCTVFGEVALAAAGGAGEPGGSSSRLCPLGVSRTSTGETRLRVAGQTVRSVAELARQLPLQVIDSESFQLLTGAPGTRRQYLDWGLFHVEHNFHAHWQRFQRALKQRNTLLRRGKISASELRVWSRELVAAGEAITVSRDAYVEQLQPYFLDLCQRLVRGVDDIGIRFAQGWDRKFSLEAALDAGMASDQRLGFTHVGPQRADIRLTVAGRPAAEVLSRGQQKLVVCALKLAQGRMLETAARGRCVYLVDDLPAELDAEHTQGVCEAMAELGSQVFITCVEQEEVTRAWPVGSRPMAVFHVEHGQVTEEVFTQE